MDQTSELGRGGRLAPYPQHTALMDHRILRAPGLRGSTQRALADDAQPDLAVVHLSWPMPAERHQLRGNTLSEFSASYQIVLAALRPHSPRSQSVLGEFGCERSFTKMGHLAHMAKGV